jgi:hypothetical protein
MLHLLTDRSSWCSSTMRSQVLNTTGLVAFYSLGMPAHATLRGRAEGRGGWGWGATHVREKGCEQLAEK